MKEFPIFENTVQNEAIINEFKGNLFEYLMAAFLAAHFGVERTFSDSFQGWMREQLSRYELWLRENNSDLITKLPILAKKTVENMISFLPDKIENVLVIGKDSSFNEKEADILLVGACSEIPISIKLCKDKSFVNTKSGGARSFIKKYFSGFANSAKWQLQLDASIERSFYNMGYQLYEIAGLEFNGTFDQSWTESGYSELPGQLGREMRSIIVAGYHEVASVIRVAMIEFFNENSAKFKEALFPVVGFGKSDILQVTCFHLDNMFRDIHLISSENVVDEFQQIVIGEIKKGHSSFEIKMNRMVLQIRPKPMNRFTTPGLKINCSVKR